MDLRPAGRQHPAVRRAGIIRKQEKIKMERGEKHE